jgi:hypothetical protein
VDRNGSAVNSGREHPVATVVGWVFGILAAVLSVFFAYMVATLISEWSTYVGHESGTASTIVAFFGILTLGAWATAAAAFYTARRNR